MAGNCEIQVPFGDYLSEAELIALAEAFGGTRVYMPVKMTDRHRVAKAIGFAAALRLWDGIGPGAIRVPLAHGLRIKHYRAQGMSASRIARRLGITENGVGKALKRMAPVPAER